MDLTVPIEEQQRALELCSEHLGGAWKNLALSQVSISRVSGGMTNLLYLCALLEEQEQEQEQEQEGDRRLKTDTSNLVVPKQVLLRIYGPSHGDTERQLEIFRQLATEKLGPRLYGSFEDGRLEEYFPSRPLKWNEMIDESVFGVVAKKIAAIQRLQVKSLSKKPNWLLDRYREYYDYIVRIEKNNTLEYNNHQSSDTSSTALIAKEMAGIDFNLEIDFIESLFELSKAPLVFSHNDLHQNNIILLHQQPDNEPPLAIEDRVVLIDFEYCSYNYRTFDAANFLNEWCFDYNGDEYPHFTYSRERFPSETKQREFLTYFAKYSMSSTDFDDDCKPSITNDSNHLYTINNGSSNNLTGKDLDKTVDMLFDEMQPFLMASNLLWTIWAIKSAYTSKIKFGYWEMAKAKYGTYLLCKENYFTQQSRKKKNYGCDEKIKVQSSKM